MNRSSLESDLLLKYPLILPVDASTYEGFLDVKHKTYHVRLKRQPETGKFHLQINNSLLLQKQEILTLSSVGDLDVVTYLDELVQIISSADKENKPTTTQSNYPTQTWQSVINEYYEFRQFYFNIYRASLSEDLRQITVSHRDSKNRTHNITIGVNYEDEKPKKLFKILDSDLPGFSFNSSQPEEETLAALYEKFLVKIECPMLQMIFDIFDKIDENCWVLEPEKPTRKDLYRRVMLEENVSALITFNSADMRDLPQIKFLGPQSAVCRYATVLAENVDKWDANRDVLQGLLDLLGLSEFPARPKDLKTAELLVNEGECCICFSLRLNGRMPEVVCSNEACSKYFHAECLYQCLCSMNPRKLGFEIMGQCPNCEKTIHCDYRWLET